MAVVKVLSFTVIRRLGISHGVAYWDHGTLRWQHRERPVWFDGTPVLTAKTMSDLERVVINEGERLYDAYDRRNKN